MRSRRAPLVSVLITCHGLGRYLDDAFDSAIAQTTSDIEGLITDDGSDDPETVSRLDAIDHPNARVMRTAHQGLARARNALIAEARGEYCALLTPTIVCILASSRRPLPSSRAGRAWLPCHRG